MAIGRKIDAGRLRFDEYAAIPELRARA